MSRRKRDTKAILRTIERSEQRSSLFWWMVEHHDEIVTASERQRIIWATFCAEATKRGLRDTRGQVPSERNARETWRQARKAVAEARATEAQPRPGSVYPSRIPKDWRPQVVTEAPGTAIVPVRRQPVQDVEPYDPVRHMAHLRQVINERSGRKE